MKLRNYQEIGANKVISNNYCGILAMATGTGKTITAISILDHFLRANDEKFIVIVMPYIHLVDQWEEEIRTFLERDVIILKCYGNYTCWYDTFDHMLDLCSSHKVIILTTNATYSRERFQGKIEKHRNYFLIVDEAHRFSSTKIISMYPNVKNRLALSATPFEDTENLTDPEEKMSKYFGGIVYSLSIHEAIKLKCLVEYDYIYTKVSFTWAEKEEYDKYKRLIRIALENLEVGQKTKNYYLIKKAKEDLGKFVTLKNMVLSNSENKRKAFYEQIINDKDLVHTIVYCGAGSTYVEDVEDISEHGITISEMTYIEQISRYIRENHPDRPFLQKFTSTESADDRKKIIKNFTYGNFDVLTAIRCLDEGVNIPLIKKMYILGNQNTHRETVQRRGRGLRLYSNEDYIKEKAVIIDYVIKNVEEEELRSLEYQDSAKNIIVRSFYD